MEDYPILLTIQQEDRQIREDVTTVDPGRETQSRQTSCRWLSHQA
jgi:hypothetical protein